MNSLNGVFKVCLYLHLKCRSGECKYSRRCQHKGKLSVKASCYDKHSVITRLRSSGQDSNFVRDLNVWKALGFASRNFLYYSREVDENVSGWDSRPAGPIVSLVMIYSNISRKKVKVGFILLERLGRGASF